MDVVVGPGALCMCSMGTEPSSLVIMRTDPAAASIGDSAPFVNVLPFGMCMSPANPVVASATASAMGVLTPMPCTPAPMGTWAPGSSSLMVDGQPALTPESTLMCTWGASISVVSIGEQPPPEMDGHQDRDPGMQERGGGWDGWDGEPGDRGAGGEVPDSADTALDGMWGAAGNEAAQAEDAWASVEDEAPHWS